MTSIFVTYPGDASVRFDRDYYVGTHLPLVLEAWRPHGLESITAFFPSGYDSGTIAMCECVFRDEEAFKAAVASPQTRGVMADVKNFTDAKPSQRRLIPV